MEAVAEAEVRMDERLVRKRGLELRAQLADVDVDRALLLAEGAVPDDRVELLAADDPAAAARECAQKRQFPDGQREWPPTREREELVGPDLQLSFGEDLVSCRFHPAGSLSEKGAKSVTKG